MSPLIDLQRPQIEEESVSNETYSESDKVRGERLKLFQQQNEDLIEDLAVFKDRNSECKDSPNDTPITERCPFTQRLCAASTYLEHINGSTAFGDGEKRSLFVEFNEDIYNLVLNDTAHFIKNHENDIQRVHSEWTELDRLPKCSVSELTLKQI